jgi:translation initiation factor 2B subunit (eIF-2B alpha/beta/delta family)
MHGKTAAACIAHGADEVAQLCIAVTAVDANAVFDRYRDIHRILHGLDAVGDQLRMAHQAGTDHVVLHPVTGAANV